MTIKSHIHLFKLMQLNKKSHFSSQDNELAQTNDLIMKSEIIKLL